jgi:uncharacterized protein
MDLGRQFCRPHHFICVQDVAGCEVWGMTPRTFIFRTIRWSAWEGCEAGIEHVDIRPADGSLDISGIVIGREGDARFGLAYRVKLDHLWRVREAHFRTTSGQVLHLESNGQGHWRENGKDRPSLQGCIDIDIQATPLTNTLPIRRLDWIPDGSAEIRLCYVDVPGLTVSVQNQRYTTLASGSLYRFESPASGFTADLPVDADGFVLDYPGLFKRLD